MASTASFTRCGPLLQMSHVARAVIGLHICDYVLITPVSCAKTAERIETPFECPTRVGRGNHTCTLDGAHRDRHMGAT